VPNNRTIASLKPDAANARQHTERNIEMIADSLRKVGAACSIVIDEDRGYLYHSGFVGV
jgi:hypothetical protein